VVKSICVFVCTIASCALFVMHYLMAIPFDTFWNVVKTRFNARTGTDSLLIQLGEAYLSSFGSLILIASILLLIVLTTKPARKTFFQCLQSNHAILFVILFALIENMIMKQHALQYTFDRMKAVIPLIFIVMACVSAIGYRTNKMRLINGMMITLSVFACGWSFVQYVQDNTNWKWPAPYLKQNRELAEELSSYYTRENSIYAQSVATRGYTNLLFERGVYEGVSPTRAYQLALENEKRYAILFNPTYGPWNMYNYNDQYVVIDLEIQSTVDITDANWINGVSTFGNVLLFANTPKSNELLLINTPTRISTGVYVANIISAEEKGNYIWLHIEETSDKMKFAYPAELEID